MFDDLGSMLQGPATQPPVDTTQQADLHSQWKGWLDNPANKAGLISFGLKAMMGGWGDGTSQLAEAIGSGLETAAGANKIEQDAATAERNRQDKLGDQSADRSSRETISANEIKSREKIANIMASTRMDVANLRTATGAKSKEEDKIYRDAYNSVDKDFLNSSGMSEDEKQLLRESRGQKALEAHQRAFGTKNTSENIDNGSAPASPAGAGKGAKDTSANNANGNADTRPSLDEYLADPNNGPKVRAALENGTASKYAPVVRDPENIQIYQKKASKKAGSRFTQPSNNP